MCVCVHDERDIADYAMYIVLTSEMLGMVAEMAINLSLHFDLSPSSVHERDDRIVFILLTMASMVGPRDSSFNWWTSSIRKSRTSCTRDL